MSMSKNGNEIVKMMRKNLIPVTAAAFLLGWCGMKYLPYEETILNMILVRFILGAFLLGVMVCMGAKESLCTVKKGMGFTLRSSVYILIISGLLSMSAVVTAVVRYGIPDGFLSAEIGNLILALSVGIFEEALFRGVLLQGLLRKMGGTKNGLWGAVLLSAIIFGALHVINYILGGSYDLVGIIQTIGKSLQAGIFGLLLAAIYLKTHNFWAIAVVHMINDFVGFQVSIMQSGTPGDTSYVNAGGMGIAASVGYLLMVVLYIPVVIKSVRYIREMKVPEYGLYKEG